MTKTAYFDCFNGAAGDMIVGALLDAGADADGLRRTLQALPVQGYELSIERTKKGGFAATRFGVALQDGHPQPHRHLRDVQRILREAPLPPSVRDSASAVFARLADAEARVHGTTVERVHFHEVGAVDAVLDVVAACWSIHQLGIETVICSPLPTGSGTIECAHGVLPIPAPATAWLLLGVPLATTDETGELTTPTGAALLTHFASSFGPLPAMTVERIGLGAGAREGRRRPNVVRVLVGVQAESAAEDRVVVLEANVDDATPEVLGYALERLLEAGALDAYCVPIQMKKSRPGVLLAVLAGVDQADTLEALILQETTTFGVRRTEARRSTLARRHQTVVTPWGEIRVKIGERAGHHPTVAPEYEDCRRAALAANVPLRAVMAAALHAWQATEAS